MSKHLREVFRHNLRARMRELGLTQQQVADASKVTQAYISQIVNGQRTPDLEVVERVAQAVRLSPVTILQEDALTTV